MKKSLRSLCLLALASVLLGACAESSLPEATGKGNIRGINAIVTAPDVTFLIEERAVSQSDPQIAFKFSSPRVAYDDLTYNFNFDIFVPEETDPRRIATRFLDVVADMDYVLVLTDTVAAPEVLVWEDPIREFDGTETVFELRIAHLAAALGVLDVYLEPTGTPPVLGNAIATVSYKDRSPAMDVEDAEYELTITPRDDPGTILFQSIPLTIAPQSQVIFAIFDDDPATTSDVSATLINANGQSVPAIEANSSPQTRAYHAVFGEVDFDLYANQDFSAPLIANVAFGELSAYADVTDGSNEFTFTEAGNQGAILLETSDTVFGNNRRTLMLGGTQGNVALKPLLDLARPLETQASLRISQMSLNIALIDVYIEDAGTPITEDSTPRLFSVPSLLDTGLIGLNEGSYEITLTQPGEITPIAPVLQLDVVFGDIVDVAILDTVDPAALDLVVFDRR